MGGGCFARKVSGQASGAEAAQGGEAMIRTVHRSKEWQAGYEAGRGDVAADILKLLDIRPEQAIKVQWFERIGLVRRGRKRRAK